MSSIEMIRALDRAMTVRELRESLEDFDDDTKVVFSYNYGDYGKTTVADPAGNVDEMRVKYSAYHRTLSVIEEEDDDGDDGDNEVVVISAG